MTEHDICGLSIPLAAYGGTICVRKRGHYAPGVSCFADRSKAARMDLEDDRDGLTAREPSCEELAARAVRANGYIDLDTSNDVATWLEEVVQPVIDVLREQGWTVAPPEGQS